MKTKKMMPILAEVIRWVLWLMLIMLAVGVGLILIGRLHLDQVVIKDRVYHDATLAQPTHNDVTGLAVTLVDQTINLTGTVSASTRVLLSIYALLNLLPLFAVLVSLAQFMGHVASGQVFSASNAFLLKVAGCSSLVQSVVVPLLGPSLFTFLIRTFTNSQLGLGIGWGQDILLGLGFLVMGYVFSYGVSLQKDVEGLI